MRIGTVEINSRLALAPMAGVTDVAFRQICAELGAGYTVTELISSKALCYHDKKTLSLLQQFPGEHPAAVRATVRRLVKRRLPRKAWAAVNSRTAAAIWGSAREKRRNSTAPSPVPARAAAPNGPPPAAATQPRAKGA